MDWNESLKKLVADHENVGMNISREEMIRESVKNGETIVSESGALATWTPPESSGRSPKDTVLVKRSESAGNIDWDSPNNLPITEETFNKAMADAIELLEKKERIYVTDRVVGADSSFALPVRTITDWATAVLFTDNMFRPVPDDLEKSIFYDRPFTIVVIPYEKLDPAKYEGHLRKLPDGSTSNMIVGMDMDRRLGVVVGSAYGGSVKKLIFTVMNYLLPLEKILPIHCSANEGPDGDSASRPFWNSKNVSVSRSKPGSFRG